MSKELDELEVEIHKIFSKYHCEIDIGLDWDEPTQAIKQLIKNEKQELLKETYPDGYVLLHKGGRDISVKLSELQWWVDYMKQVAEEEQKVVNEELEDE